AASKNINVEFPSLVPSSRILCRRNSCTISESVTRWLLISLAPRSCIVLSVAGNGLLLMLEVAKAAGHGFTASAASTSDLFAKYQRKYGLREWCEESGQAFLATPAAQLVSRRTSPLLASGTASCKSG